MDLDRQQFAKHAQEDVQAAKEKGRQVVAKLREMRLGRAAEILDAGVDETLSYYLMPPEHCRCIRTNNSLERLNREIRRRTRVVGVFPDGHSALMLVVARLRHVAATTWGTKRYLQMNRLAEVRPSPEPLLPQAPMGACGKQPQPNIQLQRQPNLHASADPPNRSLAVCIARSKVCYDFIHLMLFRAPFRRCCCSCQCL